MTPDEQAVEPPAGPGLEPSLGGRMVRGTLAQQGGLIVATITGLVVTTALARSLTLAEFGVYGFVVALATYLYFVIGTAETAAVNEMAAATDAEGLEAAFSRSIVVYALLGAAAGLVVAVGGWLLVTVLDFSPALTHQARIGVVVVGLVTAVGWVAKVFQDYQRATHRFVEASVSEAVGNLLLMGAVVAALATDAPLWVLMVAGGALPLYVGAAAVVMVAARGSWPALRLRGVHREGLREFLGFSGGILVIASSDLVISSLDRTIVGALRSASTLGLYEAASKLNGLVRTWVANLSVTLLPVLSRLRANDDRDRERQLLIVGTRYSLIAAVGPTVTLMVLSDRVLSVWLGERYVAAAPAAAIFLSWWLIAPNLSIAGTMVIVSRRLRQLMVYAWGVAAVNLVLSVGLTAWLGLVGVAIGTTVGYLVMVPYFVSFAFSGRGVTVRDLARAAWWPAYGWGAVLAVALAAIRLAFPLDHAVAVAGVAILAVVAYWFAFLTFGTSADERSVIRSFLRR